MERFIRDGIMAHTGNPLGYSEPPMDYQIRIAGHLGGQWADWFGGLTITLEKNGDTLLCGPVVDQAALYGLLRRVRDVGLPLVSVTCVNPVQSDAPDGRNSPLR